YAIFHFSLFTFHLKLLHPLPCAPDAVIRFVLQHYCQQTCDNAEQGHTLYQRRGQDHVCTDVVSSFGLAGDGFQRALTDVTYTNTSSNSSDTGANSTTSLGQTGAG